MLEGLGAPGILLSGLLDAVGLGAQLSALQHHVDQPLFLVDPPLGLGRLADDEDPGLPES